VKLFDVLNATQPEAVEALGIGEDGSRRLQFLHWLQGEITKEVATIDTTSCKRCSKPMYKSSLAPWPTSGCCLNEML